MHKPMRNLDIPHLLEKIIQNMEESLMDAKSSHASNPPSRNEEYLNPGYWNERFKTEDEYEWFKGYFEFRHLILQHVERSKRVLILGCGNSKLSENLYEEGIADITSTDLSAIVIDRMRQKCHGKEYGGIKWEVADMLDLPYENQSYDIAIEKGAMDVLFVDSSSSWDPPENVVERVNKMVSEVHRVLTVDGVFISITFGQPHFRRRFFENANLTWNMKYYQFGDGFHYFFYVLKKGTRDLSKKIDDEKVLHGSHKLDMLHDNMDSEDYLLNTMIP